MSEIWVLGAKCADCGTDLNCIPPDQDGYVFLDRNNGDKILTVCKNSVLCRERQISRDRHA